MSYKIQVTLFILAAIALMALGALGTFLVIGNDKQTTPPVVEAPERAVQEPQISSLEFIDEPIQEPIGQLAVVTSPLEEPPAPPPAVEPESYGNPAMKSDDARLQAIESMDAIRKQMGPQMLDRGVSDLIKALFDKNDKVSIAAAKLLVEISDRPGVDKAVPRLRELANSENEAVKTAAAKALMVLLDDH